MQIYIGQVPEGSGEDAEVKFGEVPVQRVPVHISMSGSGRFRYSLGVVLEGSGADS